MADLLVSRPEQPIKCPAIDTKHDSVTVMVSWGDVRWREVMWAQNETGMSKFEGVPCTALRLATVQWDHRYVDLQTQVLQCSLAQNTLLALPSMPKLTGTIHVVSIISVPACLSHQHSTYLLVVLVHYNNLRHHSHRHCDVPHVQQHTHANRVHVHSSSILSHHSWPCNIFKSFLVIFTMVFSGVYNYTQN